MYDYFKNVILENKSQEFRLRNIEKTRNYFVEEIDQHELMSKKHKKVCTTLNYFENFLVLAEVNGCISFSAFASFFSIPIKIMDSAIRLKTCTVTAGIKNYKSIIKKKKKKHDKIVLLAKSKLNSIKVLISKAFIDPDVSHNEFVLINNVLKEYDDTKEEIKTLKT